MPVISLTHEILVNVTNSFCPEVAIARKERKSIEQAAQALFQSIQNAENDSYSCPSEYTVFNDQNYSEGGFLKATTIELYISLVMSQTQMEFGCIYPAMIYLKRMETNTSGAIRLCKSNWRSTLATCLMLSSKVWDDNSMINEDFQYVFPSADLQRVNKLERFALKALAYNVNVTLTEYEIYEKFGFDENAMLGVKLKPSVSCGVIETFKQKEVSKRSEIGDDDTCANSFTSSLSSRSSFIISADSSPTDSQSSKRLKPVSNQKECSENMDSNSSSSSSLAIYASIASKMVRRCLLFAQQQQPQKIHCI